MRICNNHRRILAEGASKMTDEICYLCDKKIENIFDCVIAPDGRLHHECYLTWLRESVKGNDT